MKKGTREDNKNVIDCYFKNEPIQRGYRKRIMEIWSELAKFNSTSQILAEQARMILKEVILSPRDSRNMWTFKS